MKVFPNQLYIFLYIRVSWVANVQYGGNDARVLRWKILIRSSSRPMYRRLRTTLDPGSLVTFIIINAIYRSQVERVEGIITLEARPHISLSVMVM